MRDGLCKAGRHPHGKGPCPLCRKASTRRYTSSAKGKAARRRYNSKPNVKRRATLYRRRRRQVWVMKQALADAAAIVGARGVPKLVDRLLREFVAQRRRDEAA